MWLFTSSVAQAKLAEREGFEPPVPFDITGFQDQRLKPLGHLSMSEPAKFIITVNESFVNPFFLVFLNNFDCQEVWRTSDLRGILGSAVLTKRLHEWRYIHGH